MVISLCIARNILTFPSIVVSKKKISIFYPNVVPLLTCLKASGYIPTLYCAMSNLVQCSSCSTCSMQYDSRTALQLVHTNLQEYYRSRITIHTEGNVNCLTMSILQPKWAGGLYSWSLLQYTSVANCAVLVMSCCLSPVVLSHWAHIMDGDLCLPVYWTATLEQLPWEGLLSCHTDEAISQ